MNMRRRDFLSAAALGAAAPFVPFLNQRAEAASGFPRRLLLVFSPNGTLESQFWPTGGETNFALAKGSITEALEPFRAKLLFPKGLRRLSSGSGAHEKNMGGLWTGCGLVATNGYPTGPSVDQIIAEKLPAGPSFKSLQFGVQCDAFAAGGNKNVLKSMTYSGRNAVVSPELNPVAMFDKLMLGAGGGPKGLTPAELQATRARSQSVIDAVRGDLRSLSMRIDREDRIKMEQHLAGIAGIEQRLNQPIDPSMPINGCASPGPVAGTFADAAARADVQNYPKLIDAMNKLVVATLACDRTRVATLQWSRAFSRISHTWIGVGPDHHTLSHKTGAGDTAQLLTINRWYADRFADLLRQLDAVKEGNGTLLDNTIVVWGNEARSGQHDSGPAVFLVAGGGGGRIRTGRFLDLPGYDWSQLLTTLCHAMDVPSVTKVGELPMKEGDIPTLLNPMA
jgi:hypothetical protein